MAFTMLCCAGCQPDSAASGTLELDPRAVWEGERLELDTGIRFAPTTEMRQALERGVAIRLLITSRISRRMGFVALARETREFPVRISYLPLTEQWQLERGDEREQYPRLWLLLDALESPRRLATGLERDDLLRAAWQVQARVDVDYNALPSPMRLPALLSPQWRLGGAWRTWQFERS